MVGSEVPTIATVWLQALLFPHGSIAAQVRVATKVLPHSPLVVVVRMTIRLVPQAAAGAVGGSKSQAVPDSTVLLVAKMMFGRAVSRIVIVWLQLLLFPHGSVAVHVRVAAKVLPHSPFVTVPKIKVRLVPQASPRAVGGSKSQVEPHSTVLLVEQLIVGGVMSTTVTLWPQMLLLPHASIAAQVLVAVNVLPHNALVAVPKVTIRLVPQASPGAVGASKLQALPHSTGLLVPHVIVGGVVSRIVTVWLHVLLFPHGSTAAQARVAAKVLPHRPLVVVLRITIRLVPQAAAGAVGASKSQAAPHSTVLLLAQMMVGRAVSRIVTVWLQVLLFPHGSTAAQVRVATKVLPHNPLVVVATMTI